MNYDKPQKHLVEARRTITSCSRLANYIKCHLPIFIYVGCRDVYLPSNINELAGTSLVVLKATQKIYLKNTTAMSLSRNLFSLYLNYTVITAEKKNVQM